MRWRVTVSLALVAACGGGSQQSNGEASQAAPAPESEAPVALNPEVPIAYPPTLYEQKVEGDVMLRLFVDSTGKLIPESTRVAEPSGYAALDSAAVAGSVALKFAPGKRHGIPVATAFLQPVEFRQVGTTRAGGGTVTLPPPPAAPPAAAQPKPRPPAPPPPPPPQARPDTSKPAADTTKRPTPPPPPPPPPADTTKPRPDTSATTH
jgi:TonB family protein